MGTFPKFIVVGAQRAGTTWLYECLKEHPEVFVPDVKELHFFDLHYENGIDDYKLNFPDSLIEGKKTWGEVTPNYYQEPNALERIAEHIPHCQLIYICREPKSRLISQYELFSQTDYSGLSFKEMVASKESAIDLSLQGKHLFRMTSLFKQENIKVMFYDSLVASPEEFLKQIFTFLNVDKNFVPTNLYKRLNRVVFPKTQNLFKLLRLMWVIKAIKKSPLSEAIKRLAKAKAAAAMKNHSEIPEDLKRVFENDIKILEEITGERCDGWK